MQVECVERKYPKQEHAINGVWRVLGVNVYILVGSREAVGAGAAGRCGVGVWHLVGGHVVALIG